MTNPVVPRGSEALLKGNASPHHVLTRSTVLPRREDRHLPSAFQDARPAGP